MLTSIFVRIQKDQLSRPFLLVDYTLYSWLGPRPFIGIHSLSDVALAISPFVGGERKGALRITSFFWGLLQEPLTTDLQLNKLVLKCLLTSLEGFAVWSELVRFPCCLLCYLQPLLEWCDSLITTFDGAASRQLILKRDEGFLVAGLKSEVTQTHVQVLNPPKICLRLHKETAQANYSIINQTNNRKPQHPFEMLPGETK